MIEKAMAFLDNLTLEELDKLPPVCLRKASELLLHWHQVIERSVEPAESRGPSGPQGQRKS